MFTLILSSIVHLSLESCLLLHIFWQKFCVHFSLSPYCTSVTLHVLIILINLVRNTNYEASRYQSYYLTLSRIKLIFLFPLLCYIATAVNILRICDFIVFWSTCIWIKGWYLQLSQCLFLSYFFPVHHSLKLTIWHCIVSMIEEVSLNKSRNNLFSIPKENFYA